MQHPGSSFARGHLRLASAPVSPSPARRMGGKVRAWVAILAALLGTLSAWCTAILALLPILTRRGPVGRRLRRRPPREARVIPFQPRRRALPR